MGAARFLPTFGGRGVHARVYDKSQKKRLASLHLWRWSILGNVSEKHELRWNVILPISRWRGSSCSQMGREFAGRSMGLEEELCGLRWNRAGSQDDCGHDRKNVGIRTRCNPAV